jgi:O-antigen/teichoic acid export membrane protein
VSERFSFPRTELRARTIRGTAINAAFTVLTDGLVLLQGLLVTRLLGPGDIGLYGIVSATTMALLALKRIGIDEAWVRQSDAGEPEFQRAFTLELGLSAIFAVVIALVAPVLALVYGEGELLWLGLATSYLPLAFALQAPGWVFFRRMDFVRQRALLAIVPVVTFTVTLPLAAAGVGVWSLVAGAIAGNLAGAAAAVAVSPYKLSIRWDRSAVRRYMTFSAPVFVAGLAWLVTTQGQLLAFDLESGIEAVGFMTLAVTFTRYVDRADMAVAVTIYPAICALQGRTRQLTELFVKSNRATLLYVLPLSAGIVLFAPDLVHFALGDVWEPAIVLLQGMAVATGLGQLGFNWFSFYRAHDDTRPTAIEALTGMGGFLLLAVPGLALAGSTGFVVGRVAGVLVWLAVRARYVRAMLPTVRLWRLLARGIVPVLAGAAAALALRLALWGAERSLAQALAEAALFAAVTGAVALRREAVLIAEARAGFVGGRDQQPGQDDADEGKRGHLPVPVDAGVEGERGERGDRAGDEGGITT